MGKTNEQKGILALVILCLGFGVIAIAARHLSSYFTLFQQLYLSLAVAFIFSLFIFRTNLIIKRLKKVPKKDWFIMFLRVVIGYIIAASLYRESLVLTKISNVTFIQSIPFGAILGWILFKEKFTLKKFLLLMLAYIGVLLIAVNDYLSVLVFGKGELFSLISTGLFSFSYICRKWMTDYLDDKEMTQILLFIGAVLLAGISFGRGEPLPHINFEWLLLISLFFTGIFNVLNIYLINYGFKNVPVVLASNILTLESVFALILAFIFYRELPSLKELAGGVLILSSVIAMNHTESK